MIDVTKEITYPISALCRKLPHRRTRRTVLRWINEGVTPRGVRKPIRMEFVNIGGVAYSSVEAYVRFIEKTTRASGGE